MNIIFIRRFISIFVFTFLFFIFSITSIALFIPFLFTDKIFNKTYNRAFIFITIFLGCEIYAIFASFVLFISKLILRWSDSKYTNYNFSLQKSWINFLFNTLKTLFKLNFKCINNDCGKEGNYLLLIRHSSIADTTLAAVYLSRPYDILLRYVIKKELLFDPAIDIVGNRLNNVFIDRKDKDFINSEKKLITLMSNLNNKEGVLIYPEGTRFTPKKRDILLEKFKYRNDSENYNRTLNLKNLLPPRDKGILTLLNNNNTKADLIFCFHHGLDQIVSLKDLISGKILHSKIYVKFWRIKYEDIPKDSIEISNLIYSEWKKMDNLIEELKTTNSSQF
jgi:1-acyl-sn-glycerol-3-phosphate acyltransferase